MKISIKAILSILLSSRIDEVNKVLDYSIKRILKEGFIVKYSFPDYYFTVVTNNGTAEFWHVNRFYSWCARGEFKEREVKYSFDNSSIRKITMLRFYFRCVKLGLPFISEKKMQEGITAKILELKRNITENEKCLIKLTKEEVDLKAYRDFLDNIKVGDIINFSYGIPPVSVNASISFKYGKLVLLTPGHNPSKISVKEFLTLGFEYTINDSSELH